MYALTRTGLSGIYLFCFSCVALVAQENLESIFARSRASLDTLETLEFVVDVEDVKNGTKVSYTTIRFYHKGSMYRSEVVLKDALGPGIFDKMSLYNGKRFQVFDTKSKRLRLSNTLQLANPHFGIHPFLVPYVFLNQSGVPFVLSDLKNDQIWNGKLSGARIVGRADINGHDTIKAQITSYLPGCRWEIYFDKNQGYFPIKIELLSDDKTVSQVSTVERILPGHPFLVPLIIKFKQNINGITTESLFTIRQDSLRINGDIDDNMFTIPYTDASFIDDVDSRKIIEVGSNKTVKEIFKLQENKINWYIWITVPFSAGLLALAIYLAYRIFIQRRL